MTVQDIFTLLNQHAAILLLVMLFAPWLALGICIAIPGQREEPFVLSFNLGMAAVSLLLASGYLIYALNHGGWSRVVEEADLLLILAPCYYVGVSFWVTKQRLPLSQLRIVRILQGLGLVFAGYLGLTWFLSKLRILAITFIPFQYLVWFLLALAGVAYLGYQRITGADVRKTQRRRPGSSHTSGSPGSVDEELEQLRREMNNENR